jgi:outer membrane receptor for Fe3+-dicitrate
MVAGAINIIATAVPKKYTVDLKNSIGLLYVNVII